VVCVKHVPDASDIRFDPITLNLIREGVPSIVNPCCLNAIEEAIRIREKLGGTVTAVSMGPLQAQEGLREALAMGADDAAMVSDREMAGADTLATSYTLWRTIATVNQKKPFDIILTDDVIKENSKIVGVKTDRGDVLADVVIAADGVNSMLSKQAGLREELPPEAVVLAVKEVIALPRQRIEERFNLGPDEGIAAMLVGWGSGMHAGFMYTNRDTISLGIGISLQDLDKSGQRPHLMFEQFKNHPSIAPLVEEGDLKEYSAHLIPEGGYEYVSQVHADGMLVVGDAAMLVNAINWEGTNLAITSGTLAGETVINAKKKGDFTARSLQGYKEKLVNSFVLKDLKKYKGAPKFFANNQQFFTLYPEIVNELVYMWHVVDDATKEEKMKEIKSTLFKHRSKLGLLKDAYHFWRLMS